MKIKRFNEDINNDISKDRVSEIIEDLRVHISDINSKKDIFETLLIELSNYKSKSTDSNDQIDDSIVNIDLIIEELSSSVNNIDTVINSLINFVENGRKYLYNEK